MFKFGKNINSNKNTWGTPEEKYSQKSLILSENVFVSPDKDNSSTPGNTLVIGGPGRGKGRNYILPNLLQFNSNYIIVDPKGEMAFQCNDMFRKAGYNVKVVNLTVDMPNLIDGSLTSLREYVADYNPFAYLKTEADIYNMADILCSNLPGTNMDSFWNEAQRLFLIVLIGYVNDMCEEKEKSLAHMVEILGMSYTKDMSEAFAPEFTAMMNEYCLKFPESIGARSFGKLMDFCAPSTIHSVAMGLMVDFQYLNLKRSDGNAMFGIADTLYLNTFRNSKTVLFIVTSTISRYGAKIQSLLISQAFDVFANNKIGEPVHFMLDEFPQFKIPNIERMLAVSKNCKVYFSIIIQAIEQINEKTRELVIGNCRNILWLGTSSPESIKFVANMIEHAAVKSAWDLSNVSFCMEARPLITAEEIRMMFNTDALVLMIGKQPIYDKKYMPEKHPNYIKGI